MLNIGCKSSKVVSAFNIQHSNDNDMEHVQRDKSKKNMEYNFVPRFNIFIARTGIVHDVVKTPTM